MDQTKEMPDQMNLISFYELSMVFFLQQFLLFFFLLVVSIVIELHLGDCYYAKQLIPYSLLSTQSFIKKEQTNIGQEFVEVKSQFFHSQKNMTISRD